MASNKAKQLEQSLQQDLHPFAARMSPISTPPPSEASFPRNQESEKRPNTQTRKGVKTQTPKRLSAETRFDLNEPAPVRRGFYFTDEELWALDDLKKDLIREVDLKINQYDIVRIGIHFLIEDYQ